MSMPNRSKCIATAAIIACTIVAVALGEPNDPRCAAHTCASPPGFTERDFPSDSSTCAYETCPKCLVGAEWDARKAELGTGTASRTFEPSLVFGDWLSTELSETTFRILAEEMLGYSVNATATYVNGFDILCCERSLVYMEKWEGEVYPNDDGFFSFTQLNNGYEGSSGLYVARHTLDAYPLATAANAYKYLADYQNIFPKAFSTPCELLISGDNTTCAEENYFCAENEWTNTTCQQGRYVPPQCQGALAAGCQEVLFMHPAYESGFFEALIKNNGLKFVVVYVGYDNALALLSEAQKTKQHLLFYAWEPDPMVNLVDAEPIVWKSPTAECRAKESYDPLLSGGDCDYGKRPLTKVMQTSRLERDPDFKFFFESFQLQSSDMRGMLREHVEGGGNKNVYNVSCDWLKSNYVRWKDWIRNTPSASSAKADTTTNSNTAIIAAAVAAPLAVLFIGIAVFGILRARNAKSAANAPKETPFTLLFTDVESSTMLWERHGSDMAKAMEIHHSVIREAIEEHNCYEVKTIGDSFMIAGKSLPDAVLLAVTIQRRMQAAPWPKALRNWKDVESGDEQLWRGLRIRIGLRYCQEAAPKFEAVNGRYDYYGHDVNMAARVESMARGGQILMTEDTYDALLRDLDAALVTDEAVFYRFATGVELKGISDKQIMMCCVPHELKARHFEPIEGCPADETHVYDPNSSQQDMESNPSETHSQATGSQFGMNDERAEISRAIRLIFAGMKDVREREAALASIAGHRGLDLTAGQSDRVAFQRRLRVLIDSITHEIRGDGQPYTTTALLPSEAPRRRSSLSGSAQLERKDSHVTVNSNVE